MDVVYIHKNTGAGHEMRFSLRSLGNIAYDRVFVVGECQPWMQGIEYIENKQHSTVTRNALSSFIKALDSDISDDFIFMHDDHYIMRYTDRIPLYRRGSFTNVLENIRQIDGHTDYWKVCGENLEYLRSIGIENPLSYHLHMPMVFNKHKMKESIEQTFKDRPEWWNQQYAVIYYNRYGIKDEGRIIDPKIRPLQSVPSDSLFLSSGNASFKQLRSLLKSRFPYPSEYENDVYRF